MSIGDATLALDNRGYVLVSGTNNNPNDLAKSNGSGKSSIFEAIIWNLTGDTIRGTKQVVNKFSPDGTCVELVFMIDNDKYHIIRYKEHTEFGTDLKIFVNDTDKSGKGVRDTCKLLEEYLPDLTLNLLGSVMILGQGLPQRFTNNTPAGRKEVLEKLSKSDFLIEDIKAKLTKNKLEYTEQIRQLEDAILADSNQLKVYNENLDKLKIEKLSLKPFTADDTKKLQEYTTKVADLNTDLNTKNAALNTTKDLCAKVFNNKSNLINQAAKEKLDIIATQSKLLETITKEKSEKTVVINNLKAEILTLESVKDICPTCGQKLPDVHKVDTCEHHKKLQLLEEDLKVTLEKEIALTDNKQKILNEYEINYNNKLNSLDKSYQDYSNNIKNIEADIQTINTTINTYTIEINKLELLKNTYTERINKIEADITACIASIDAINEKILYNNIDKDNKEAHLNIVIKMLTIATRDFRGFLLSEVINYINNKAKEYSQDIFETDKIDFSLDINISYCDKQYENLSGGEKQKVDLIIQFSIRDMLSQFLNFSSNILVCDEIFDNCDSIGCQHIIDMISKRLSDVDSIFIITHHENELAIPYDLQLNIVKNELGISEIIE